MSAALSLLAKSVSTKEVPDRGQPFTTTIDARGPEELPGFVSISFVTAGIGLEAK
jgi:hypothetical protein